MGTVFRNAVLDQLIGRRVSSFIQIGFDFFPQGLLRGKGRRQRLDLLQAEGHIHRDFFLRVGMVEERAQQLIEFLTLCGVVELPGNILHRLGVILAVVHTGTVKLANKAQHLGSQYRIGVWGFFFLGRFLYPGRHGRSRRLLVLCKERKGSLPEGGEVFKRLLAQGVHPVALRGGFPNGNHHLVDFLHAGRVVKLRLDDLHRVPIIEAKRIGVRLFLGYVLEERADIPGKLVLFILRHGSPVVLG